MNCSTEREKKSSINKIKEIDVVWMEIEHDMTSDLSLIELSSKRDSFGG